MSRERSSRMRKVDELMREVLADEVGRLKDPRIGFVTITGVETSPDLRRAAVFFSVLDAPAGPCGSPGAHEVHAAARVPRGSVDRTRSEDEPASAGAVGSRRGRSVVTPMEAVAAELRKADRLAVAGHVGPDGDALGSMLGLAGAARAAGKDAFATFGEPFVMPHQLAFLDAATLVGVAEIPEPLDLLVVVDCGDRARLGTAEVLADKAARVAVIDHHRTNGGFGDVSWIEPDAGATAQMVHRLLAHLDWPVDATVAEALYTGIVTDTGRFQYSSTSPQVHTIAARLLEAGVQPDRIGQRLFASSPFGYLGVAGAVLTRAILEPDIGLVWSVLEEADLERAGIGYEAADGLIDLIRIAEEAGVACLLRELDGGRTKGSLRSRGAVDVGAIAASLGGGGHRNAAGFTVDATPEEAIERVRQALA
jgi:phosphoesterase RecJ-like protein